MQRDMSSLLMDNPKKHTILYYTPAIGWGILICYFSLMPGNELPGLLRQATDILLHFGIYLVLTLLFVFGKSRYKMKSVPNKWLLWLCLGISLMGISIEFIQEQYIQGRHFEWSDILFNTLGSVAAAALNRFLN